MKDAGPKGQDGYTLTEMLVVIAIIGLIAAVLTPGLMNQLGRARVKTAQLQIDTVVASLEMFHSDLGRYPSSEEGLEALISEPAGSEGWTGPYLRDRKALTDPWGHPLRLRVDDSAETFKVISLGSDGKPGGTGLKRDLSAPADL